MHTALIGNCVLFHLCVLIPEIAILDNQQQNVVRVSKGMFPTQEQKSETRRKDLLGLLGADSVA